VRDALPGALLDCGVAMPGSDVAAATISFTHLARTHVDGLAGPQRVGHKVEEVLIRSGYEHEVIALPLGRLTYIADERGTGWGSTDQELAAIVRGSVPGAAAKWLGRGPARARLARSDGLAPGSAPGCHAEASADLHTSCSGSVGHHHGERTRSAVKGVSETRGPPILYHQAPTRHVGQRCAE
jgi:hypothetical protein